MSPPMSNPMSPAGWMNPSQMVQTSQGVMHRDAAARLGLPGTPIPSGDWRRRHQ